MNRLGNSNQKSLRSFSTSEQRNFSMPSFVKDASLRSIFEMQVVRQVSQQTRAVETGKNRELSDLHAPNSPQRSEMSREGVQVTKPRQRLATGTAVRLKGSRAGIHGVSSRSPGPRW